MARAAATPKAEVETMPRQPLTGGVRCLVGAVAATAAILIGGAGFPGGAALAQDGDSGVIAGRVTADRGRGARPPA